jgi:hypothetical protein
MRLVAECDGVCGGGIAGKVMILNNGPEGPCKAGIFCGLTTPYPPTIRSLVYEMNRLSATLL